jgi:hypothetical protein
MAAVPFSLDDRNSVKVADCDVSTIATTNSTASSSSTASIGSTSSSSQCAQVNVNVNAKSPLNNSNNYRYEYRVTIRMPVVAEECMKLQTIRKTNLLVEAKLQTKQQQRKKEKEGVDVCWIACFLVSIVYQGKMGRIVATLPYASLAFIIMK